MYISNNQQMQASKEKHSPEVSSSPKLARKPSNVNNKELLNEFEEKLKAMRQKRLSRLNNFVDEQTKLSEIRSKPKESDDGEIDLAIPFIQKEPVKPKPAFKTIAEEVINSNTVEKNCDKSKTESVENKQTVKNKASSTIKFINKFSCVGVPAVEYLSDEDTLTVPRSDTLENRQNSPENNRKSVKSMAKSFQRNTINFPDNFSVDLQDKINQTNFSKTLPLTKPTPSLTNKNVSEDNINKDKDKQEDRFVKNFDSSVKRNSLNDLLTSDIDVNTNGSYDRTVRQPMVTFGKANTNLKKVSSCSFLDTLGMDTNATDEAKLKKEKNVVPQKKFKPFDLPVMSPQQLNKEEKILKKLQRNYVTINEIVENSLNVDSEELEDFRKTASETRGLLVDFEGKIRDLQFQVHPLLKLEDRLLVITNQLEDTKEEINKFRGLRTDDSCVGIQKRLLGFVDEIKNIPGLSEEKSVVLSSIDNCVDLLESKVRRHEIMLQELLKEQVDIIGSRHLPIIV